MTGGETKRIHLSRQIHQISRILILFIVLHTACCAHAQATANTSTNNGVSGSSEHGNSTAKTIFIVGSLLSFATSLAYYAYLLCCHQNVSVSPPFQNSAANGGLTWRGLDHDTIETFPILLYSTVKSIKIGSESMGCAICLSEFEDDDMLRFIPICHHVFHPGCIDVWLSSRITCPVCRANLAEKFEQERLETNRGDSQSESIETQAADQVVVVAASEVQNVVVSPKPKKVNRKFPRSHSTGHSIVLPGESTERYTLRLPEEVRRQILIANAKLKRVRSMNLILDTEGSSRKGRRSYAGDEGSGKGTRMKSLQIERPKMWGFRATPPFVTRGGGGSSVGIERFCNDTEWSSTLLAPIKTPDLLSGRNDGVESSSSARPPV